MQSSFSPAIDQHFGCHLSWAQKPKELLEFTHKPESSLLLSHPDPRGWAPLHYAVASEEVTSMLLDSEGVDENIRDDDLNTPLHHACGIANVAAAEALVNHGAAINVQNAEGKTPLALAICQHSVKLVVLLLTHGADPNLCGLEGETALHIAVASKNITIVNTLLAHGAHVNAADEVGDTPLHWAVREGDVAIVATLLKQPTIVKDAVNEDEETPLHLAASFGDISIAELLLSSGMNSEMVNSSGLKAAEEAALNGFTGLSQLLSKGSSPTSFEDYSESRSSPSKEVRAFGTSPYATPMFAM